jgi:1D-myo-inositol-triphosphate 3-kinase
VIIIRENSIRLTSKKMTKQFLLNNRRSFLQLAGHKECFKLGIRPDTILKKSTDNEEECLMMIQQDPDLAKFAPKIYGTVELNGQTFLEMQDLSAGFNNPSVMDVKMGYRTYCEDELYKALRESQLRHDMFIKMIEVDENEPTPEERRLRAVTKPRYMIWRESVSSTASLGFRIEAMRLNDGTIDKDFKTIKEEEQIAKAFIRYTKSLGTRLRYLHRLYDLKQALLKSRFFSTHELIGTSLLFIHDDDNAGIWLIDFAKTHSLPDDTRVTHRNKWELGNHEDGYLAGIENLIRIFESISTPRLNSTL